MYDKLNAVDDKNLFFMKKALKLANKALIQDEVPVG
jgi:hypothetical protein